MEPRNGQAARRQYPNSLCGEVFVAAGAHFIRVVPNDLMAPFEDSYHVSFSPLPGVRHTAFQET
jgi:hypothetical protein